MREKIRNLKKENEAIQEKIDQINGKKQFLGDSLDELNLLQRNNAILKSRASAEEFKADAVTKQALLLRETFKELERENKMGQPPQLPIRVSEPEIKITKCGQIKSIGFAKQTLRQLLESSKTVNDFTRSISAAFEKEYGNWWECVLMKSGGYGEC